MSSINQLSEASAVSSSMQIPVYDTGNGQPRKISVNQLVEFIADNPSNPDVPVPLPSFTVAELTDTYLAASYANHIVYCSNGNAGAKCLAVSDGSAWKVVALGATIST